MTSTTSATTRKDRPVRIQNPAHKCVFDSLSDTCAGKEKGRNRIIYTSTLHVQLMHSAHMRFKARSPRLGAAQEHLPGDTTSTARADLGRLVSLAHTAVTLIPVVAGPDRCAAATLPPGSYMNPNTVAQRSPNLLHRRR